VLTDGQKSRAPVGDTAAARWKNLEIGSTCIVRPRIHAFTAALGFFASFGALADKGSSGGVSNGLGWGRGGSRFVDGGGAGPASAFDQHANLVKGGLEFQATPKAAFDRPGGGRGLSTPSSSGSPGKSSNDAPNANSSGDVALLIQGAASSGAAGKVKLAENDAAVLFAPWKVTAKDGKPVEKKAGLECGAK